jgi:hypothetical protein
LSYFKAQILNQLQEKLEFAFWNLQGYFFHGYIVKLVKFARTLKKYF